MSKAKLEGLRVAIYARFSSEKQRESSIEDQVRRCREFVEREGGQVTKDLVFADQAVSGASLNRPGFESMMALVVRKPPAIDCIVTEDVSRVTRDFADGATLFRKLQFLGVPLIGVGDGIDTSAKHGKLSFAVKNLVADLYLEDLRDKTLRGLEGRQLAGLSTGNPPYGYRSVAIRDAYDRELGFKIEIDEEKAAVVRRVFTLYLDGHSLTGIAKLLCKENVLPPRAHTRHRRKGWVDSTVRVFLHNEKYIGVWRFKEREWVKVPGENRRQPRWRDKSEVMEALRPELRIIDQQTWEATQARLKKVREHFTRHADGSPKGRAISGKATGYLFSGLLYCGVCSAPLIILGGKSSAYYRCPDHSKRGTCPNSLGIKERIVRERLIEALREHLLSRGGVVMARKKIAERLGELSREWNKEADQRRGRLARTEARIKGLIGFIADGDHSPYIRSTLADLEAQAKAEKNAIAELEQQAAEPVRLPSPAEVEKLVFEMEALLAADVIAGRERLRRLFKDGRIVMEPQPDRAYLARTELLPLVLMVPKKETPSQVDPERVVSRTGSGGKI